MDIGQKAARTVDEKGRRVGSLKIDGVRIIELHNVITQSGWLTEVFRADWQHLGLDVRHVIFSQMNIGGVTGWHSHGVQTDHLVALGGNIKLVLWDGRETSPTSGASEVIRMGAVRPLMAVVPPGVWHGLRNESGQPAAFLNFTEHPFHYDDPDDIRPASSEHIPVDL